MKIILAFDSFKGSISAAEAVEAARCGVQKVYPEATIVGLPLADGGEGTVAALSHYLSTTRVSCSVHDPLMRPITASYARSIDGRTAIIEMAATAGLPLLRDDERNPLKTTTFGVGEMMLSALNSGCRNLKIAIGGSATNDAGMGMLAALGAHFYNANDEELLPIGENLEQIARVDTSALTPFTDVQLDVICDVTNPLFGVKGAAYVYAPQKGASPEAVERLDSGLRHFSRFFSVNPYEVGTGAAGGLGYALKTLGANLCRGVDVVLEASQLTSHLDNAHLVITGEGSIDSQTLNGKLPFGVLQCAQRQGVKVAVFAGRIKDIDPLLAAGFSSIRSINPPDEPIAVSMQTGVAKRNLQTAIFDYLETYPL